MQRYPIGCRCLSHRRRTNMVKWISVEDDKPDEFVSVLGHMTDAGDFPAVRECYRVGNVFFFPALRDIYPIDKWTYIPEPGKEDA